MLALIAPRRIELSEVSMQAHLHVMCSCFTREIWICLDLILNIGLSFKVHWEQDMGIKHV
jgi:hypothetical protein